MKKEKTEFQSWIEKIPHSDYDRVRASIIRSLDISRATFASWSRGDSSPSSDNQMEIAFIAYMYDKSQVFKRMVITDKNGVPEMVVKQKNVTITATLIK